MRSYFYSCSIYMVTLKPWFELSFLLVEVFLQEVFHFSSYIHKKLCSYHKTWSFLIWFWLSHGKHINFTHFSSVSIFLMKCGIWFFKKELESVKIWHKQLLDIEKLTFLLKCLIFEINNVINIFLHNTFRWNFFAILGIVTVDWVNSILAMIAFGPSKLMWNVLWMRWTKLKR